MLRSWMILHRLKNISERKALLISATGTGKTYASAFAMRELGFQRVLFLVHRNQIAKQAKKSFRKVFSGQVSMGLVTGKYQEYDKNFIFATIQTLSKEENLHRYEKNTFDAIVIDEAHHSAANSYKKVLDYFEPKLWLGMTATPDKRDDNLEGRNIYEIFNHQIAYEIRLQDAMEEDLLSVPLFWNHGSGYYCRCREIIRRKGGELPLSDIRRACGKCHETGGIFRIQW